MIEQMFSDDLKTMALLWSMVLLLCFIAPLVDLGSGVYKAKQRNERITSYGLHRTVLKILTYDGSVLLAGFVDVIIHHAHLWQLLGIDLLKDVPALTVVMGVFNIFVEMVSVRERADKKADKRATDQLVRIVKTFSSDEVRQLLDVLGKSRHADKETESTHHTPDDYGET